jgi:hypothetical protein
MIPDAPVQLRRVLKLGQGPRWRIPVLLGLGLGVLGGAGILLLSKELKTMHPPGETGYTLGHFFGPPNLHNKVATWKAYWDLDTHSHSTSPLLLGALIMSLDFILFIPGYVFAALAVLGQALTRWRWKHTFMIAALLILVVAVLDVIENSIMLYLVAHYWNRGQRGPLDVALGWITKVKWTFAILVSLVAVPALLLMFAQLLWGRPRARRDG